MRTRPARPAPASQIQASILHSLGPLYVYVSLCERVRGSARGRALSIGTASARARACAFQGPQVCSPSSAGRPQPARMASTHTNTTCSHARRIRLWRALPHPRRVSGGQTRRPPPAARAAQPVPRPRRLAKRAHPCPPHFRQRQHQQQQQQQQQHQRERLHQRQHQWRARRLPRGKSWQRRPWRARRRRQLPPARLRLLPLRMRQSRRRAWGPGRESRRGRAGWGTCPLSQTSWLRQCSRTPPDWRSFGSRGSSESPRCRRAVFPRQAAPSRSAVGRLEGACNRGHNIAAPGNGDEATGRRPWPAGLHEHASLRSKCSGRKLQPRCAWGRSCRGGARLTCTNEFDSSDSGMLSSVWSARPARASRALALALPNVRGLGCACAAGSGGWRRPRLLTASDPQAARHRLPMPRQAVGALDDSRALATMACRAYWVAGKHHATFLPPLAARVAPLFAAAASDARTGPCVVTAWRRAG